MLWDKQVIFPLKIDELMKDYQKPVEVIGENGLLKQLTKALVERALKSELTQHLGYGKNEEAAADGSEEPDAPDGVRR